MMRFNENIPAIKKIVFSIGGFDVGYETRTVTFDDKHLYIDVEHTLSEPSIPHIERDKAEFLDEFSKLNIGEWHKEYVDNDVCDGTQRGLDIYFSNNRKPVKIYGSNAYPYNFKELKDLFGIGEQEC